MMYEVYILYSGKHNKTYVGYTKDLTRRLFEHNQSSTKGYCCRYRPWEILHKEAFLTKEESLRQERFYKSGKGREKIKALIKVRYPPQAYLPI